MRSKSRRVSKRRTYRRRNVSRRQSRRKRSSTRRKRSSTRGGITRRKRSSTRRRRSSTQKGGKPKPSLMSASHRRRSKADRKRREEDRKRREADRKRREEDLKYRQIEILTSLNLGVEPVPVMPRKALSPQRAEPRSPPSSSPSSPLKEGDPKDSLARLRETNVNPMHLHPRVRALQGEARDNVMPKVAGGVRRVGGRHLRAKEKAPEKVLETSPPKEVSADDLLAIQDAEKFMMELKKDGGVKKGGGQ